VTVRIGIHTGLVVVGEIGAGGHREQLALGDTPNIASRILALARPGAVLITAATKRLIDRFFELEDLDDQSVQGVVAPIRVFRVAGERPDASTGADARSGVSRFVGRETELGLLLGRFARAREGRGQLVLVTGEAGVGKSRLVRAMHERLADAP